MDANAFGALLKGAADALWGPPLVLMLGGVGIFLSVRLRLVQFTHFIHAFYLGFVKRKESDDRPGDITHFQALMTALSATVGVGNIAGVAIALKAGGPGALFWMWLTGLLGMATKYAEAVLAVHFRVQAADGRMLGGPMYYLSRGLSWGKAPALAFAIFGALASFGIGNMSQAHQTASALAGVFGTPVLLTAIVIALATGAVLIGGIRSLARVTQVITPAMIILYVAGGVGVLAIFADRIPGAFARILGEAFSPSAAGGGILGGAFLQALYHGMRRGMFSNESGLGSAPIAAAAARTNHPVAQALVSMTQTFIDTIVVCTITGLVILVSGVSLNDNLQGEALTRAAFSAGLGATAGGWIVAISLSLFAYSTLLGWSYYGEKCAEYVFGMKVRFIYRTAFTILAFTGCLLQLDSVINFSDAMNALMAIPNLIGLLALSGVAATITRQYDRKQTA
ncbi:MAG: sodium:alanine symporter family protein [Leptospirales bacterium]|nr:sodium:alanine symporter family protein [Leptospirales bacterium]